MTNPDENATRETTVPALNARLKTEVTHGHCQSSIVALDRWCAAVRHRADTCSGICPSENGCHP